MKNFSQLITEPNKYVKNNTNEFVGLLITGAIIAYACAPGIKKAFSLWDFLSNRNKDSKDKDSTKNKDSKNKDSKDKETFNSLLMLAKQSNEKEKNENEKKKNDSMLKLLIACSFDKDGNEIPVEERIDKMKDSMSPEQF